MSFYDGPTLGSEYTMDILSWLKGKERNSSHYIRRQSPQLEKRSLLIDWTKDVAEKLGLHEGTLHLAVRLIDLFMDGHDIQVFPVSIMNDGVYLFCLEPSAVSGLPGFTAFSCKNRRKGWPCPKVFAT